MAMQFRGYMRIVSTVGRGIIGDSFDPNPEGDMIMAYSPGERRFDLFPVPSEIDSRRVIASLKEAQRMCGVKGEYVNYNSLPSET